MEISQEIISKSLTASHSSSLDSELNDLLIKLESKTIEDLINKDTSEDTTNLHHEIYQVLIKAIHQKTEEEKIQRIGQLIFTQKSYLVNGILKADIKSIFIFLSVNCYLNIGLESILDDKPLPEYNTEPLSENIYNLLQKMKFETHALPGAPYHEKQMMTESEQAFIDNDIKKTYRLIEAIERSGRGFHFNFLLEHLITFLNNLNFPFFLKALSVLGNPKSFVFYLQSLKKEKLLQLANEPSLINRWLNFEIIRQIIEKEGKEDFEESDRIPIKNVLTRIQTNDFDFFKQTIQYFSSSRLFNASLGEQLIAASNSQIQEIIKDCFVIDRYTFHYDAKNIFLKHFSINASEDKYKFLLSSVFEKWKTFIESLYSSEDFFQNELMLTDFCEFVVTYYSLLVKDEDLISQMKSLILKIRHIDSEWFASESRQLTKFHLYHSQLYLLSYAYKNKKLKDIEIVNLFAELKNNEIQIQRYFQDGIAKHFKIIAENLN